MKAINYHVKMPAKGYEALKQIAQNDGRVLADVIREALEQYVASKGQTVSFEVERGGNRRGSKDDPDKEANDSES